MWDSGREMYRIEMSLYERKKNSVISTSLEDHENSESNFLFLNVQFSAYIRPGAAISCCIVTMRSWVQVLETASCKNAEKDCGYKTQSGRTLHFWLYYFSFVGSPYL
jgi:hypothetical protein